MSMHNEEVLGAADVKGLAGWFVTRSREGGEKYVTLREGRPEWLQDAVREAHDESLPNDWIYAVCMTVCESIDEGMFEGTDGDGGDALYQFADSQVDIYTTDLFQWAADMCLSSVFLEAEGEVVSNGSLDGEASMSDRLMAIQRYAVERIARVMFDAWEAANEGSNGEVES